MDQAQELELGQEVAVEGLSSMLIVEHAVGIGLGIVDASVVQGIVEDIQRAVHTDQGQADHTPSVVGDVHIPSAKEVAAVDMD